MPTPQFSLRRLLVLVTVCAVLCLIPILTGNAKLWAAGVVVAVVAAALLLAVNAALYAVVQILGRTLARRRSSDQAAR